MIQKPGGAQEVLYDGDLHHLGAGLAKLAYDLHGFGPVNARI
jgi:hypothetical protein